MVNDSTMMWSTDEIDPDFSRPHPDDDNQEESTPCKRILNIECEVIQSIKISMVYEDNTRDEKTVTKNDRIQVTYVKDGKLETVRGLITNILRGPKVLNRITNKMENIYSLKLDCSTRYGSDTRIIYCELIRELKIIVPVEDDEIEIDKEYLEDNYFNKPQVDYLISWQDIDGTEIE